MRYYPFPETKTTKTLFALFLTALLFLARDTLVTSSILGFNKSQFLMLGIVCVAALAFLLYNRRNLKWILLDKRMLLVFAVTVLILGPMVWKRDWQMMYFSILLCLYVAIFLTYFLSYRDAAKYYVLILTVLGVYSIIAMWVLRPLLVDTGILSVPMFCNQMDFPFYNFGLSFVSQWYVKSRNFGIFREPGVYQYFIILALFLNNYAVSWKSQHNLWFCNFALAATMLSTLATGGVAELGLLAIVVFFDKKLYRDKKIWAFVIVCAVIVAILAGYIILEKGELYWELYYMLIGKFKPGVDSSSERMDAMVGDLQIFLAHPLMGGRLAEVLHSAVNNTTSTLIQYAVFGILGGSLHVAAWMALIWQKERKLWVNLLLIPILFVSFNTQNLTADVFFWLFAMMALTEKVLPKLHKEGNANGT